LGGYFQSDSRPFLGDEMRSWNILVLGLQELRHSHSQACSGGGVNRAASCQLAVILSKASIPFAPRATPLRITAEEFLAAATYVWIPESSYEWRFS